MPRGFKDPLDEDYEPTGVAAPHEEYEPEVKHRAADYPRMDLTNPAQFRAVTRHISNVHAAGTPEEAEAGRLWYPKVHEATVKGARRLGVSHLAASGLVAAVSPNMDWERNNITAFGEMGKLKEGDWQTIRHSAEATRAGPYHRRTQAAHDVLRGTSLSTAADSALMKAHRIMQGEDPNEVLNPRTGPKTHSFMHNIHDPAGHAPVTIDARAHDIGQNQMWPWEYSGRGISSSQLPSSTRRLKSGAPAKSFGKRTRYELFSDAYKTAAGAADVHPNTMQAQTWLTGKRLERSAPTASGAVRQKGVTRRRQSYL